MIGRGARFPDAKAFTLVELLVVIAIVGVLAGLLVPALQAARESGRRTQCTSNLKHIGLAIATYESARKAFPCGRPARDPLGYSWAFALLPWLEEQQTFDAWVRGVPVYDDRNARAMRTPVAVSFCPSRRAPAASADDGSARKFGSRHAGVTSFVFLDGHVEPIDNETASDVLLRQSVIGDGPDPTDGGEDGT